MNTRYRITHTSSPGFQTHILPTVLFVVALTVCPVVAALQSGSVSAEERAFVVVDAPPLTADRASTGGVSFVDYDLDGDVDLFVTNGYDVSAADPAPQRNLLYQNNDGRFEATKIAVLTELDGFSSGSAWADFDNDGDLDTFIANQRDQENFLLLQETPPEGGRRFSRHGEGPTTSDGGWSYSVSVADADNDGLVDIYVSNGGLSHSGVNFLYRNVGGTGFESVSGIAPVTDDQASGGASWSDYDGDGDQDLVVANRPTPEAGGYRLALYRNDGGMRFTRMDGDALSEDAAYPMSVAWGDVDNDGDQDLYVANLYGLANELYENQGDGTFRRRDGGRATTDGGSSYSATFGDLDNDGDLDLVVANWGGSSEIYLNDGSGTFEQVDSDAFQRIIHYGSSLALGDYDLDGDLDILIGNWPNRPGEGLEENVLIENRYADGNWLRVSLEGVASNRSAIGARIEVDVRHQGKRLRQVREVSTHSGWRSQGELTQHFGLGAASEIERLMVYWPSGTEQTVAVESVNQTVSVREGT